MTDDEPTATLNDSERVYRRLRSDIIEGRFPPGARIVEQRIATSLDVSRTPVREALRRLETEGLVVGEPNRGSQVRPLSETDIADLYEARSRLEAFAAELAARRGEPEEIQTLLAAAASFEELVDAPDPDPVTHTRALVAANSHFHETLLTMGRADRIRRLLSGAVDLPLVFQALDVFSPDELRRSALFHHLIAQAVAAREPDRAARLMTEHVLQGRDALLRHRNGLDATGTEG